MIDSRQASEALSEINDIAHRVRQSQLYNISSHMMVLWGGLVRHQRLEFRPDPRA